MPLTDTAVRNLKAGEKAFKKADGGGLYLLVTTTGAKLWRMDYRFFDSRKTLALGQYPAISLSDARAGREAAKKLLASDIDPGVQKRVDRAAKASSTANTFAVAVSEFLSHMEKSGKAPGTIEKNRWMLEDIASPLARRPLTEISSAEVFALLQKVVHRGRAYTASETKAAISRVFRLAIINMKAQNDPTYALRGAIQAPEADSYAAIVDPVDLGGLIRAINGYDGWVSLRAALRMQAICFARPGETRSMNLAEINFKKSVWTIPAEKTKVRRPHDVPLSNQALEVIESMRPQIGKHGDVFPSMMSGKRFLSENSMNSALRRMGFARDQHTAHGFRSSASTRLNASKLFSGDAIEAQLAHLDRNAVRRIYNRWDYWDERVPMMQWWADYLDQQAGVRTPT